MSTKNLESNKAIYEYTLQYSLRESEILRELREVTAKDSSNAVMQIPPEQGQFMSLLMQLINAKRTIEIGVFTGYSTLCVAQAMPYDSYTLACDVSEEWTNIAQEYWEKAGVREKIELKIGPAIETLESLGASVEPVSLPTTRYALACYYIIAPSECSANLARYDGVKYGFSYQDTQNMWEAMERTRAGGFGPEVKRRVILGAYALSAGYYDAYYLKAQQARTLIRRDFDRVFDQVDALVTPTSPVVAFRLGEKINDPVEMYLIDVCTVPANIAGLPGISVPCGFSQGLPVGMQLIGPHLSEQRLLNIAYAYEQATSWHTERPEL